MIQQRISVSLSLSLLTELGSYCENFIKWSLAILMLGVFETGNRENRSSITHRFPISKRRIISTRAVGVSIFSLTYYSVVQCIIKKLVDLYNYINYFGLLQLTKNLIQMTEDNIHMRNVFISMMNINIPHCISSFHCGYPWCHI